jgi:type II secretory pathway pseudopilin PulG
MKRVSTMNNKRGQSGITLIEVAVGLIIAAILAAAAFTAFQNNSRRASVRDNVQQITEIGAELKNKFGRSNAYAGVNTNAAIRNVVIPPDLRGPDDGTNATASNSYGGVIEVRPATINVANDGAALIWDQVPVVQCTDLILSVESGTREIGLAVAGNAAPATVNLVGSSTATLKDATGAGKVLNPADVGVQCETVAGTDETVQVLLVFGRN